MYISIYIYTYLVTCDDLFKPKPSQVEIGWDIDNCFTQIHRNRIKTHMFCDSPQMHQHLEIAYLFHMVLRCWIVIAQWVPYIRKYRHLAIWISQKNIKANQKSHTIILEICSKLQKPFSGCKGKLAVHPRICQWIATSPRPNKIT